MDLGRITSVASSLTNWLALARDQGADVSGVVEDVVKRLEAAIRKAQRMKPSEEMAVTEPTDLGAIRALRPRGPRVIGKALGDDALRDRLHGAWLGRCAGCVLGIPCEGQSREEIEMACRVMGERYPLSDYWTHDPKPTRLRRVQYGITPRERFLKPKMRSVGADDDLVYTLLGLLILEEQGLDFSPNDVGEMWLKYLPKACTAEAVALANLRNNLTPPETAHVNNPYVEWIGADIRSDPWGYAAPGLPELAAEFAWRDATVSHIRCGVHGAMYFSAVIAAALVTDDVEEALRIGLTEIPRNSRMARTVNETLRWCGRDGDWGKTLDRIAKRYEGMSRVHTLNNAAITLAGLLHGEGDFGKTITLTVMGGLDTDCTGATAGSIIGAVLGEKRLPAEWKRPLGSYADSYLIGKPRFTHAVVVRRFLKIAKATRARAGV